MKNLLLIGAGQLGSRYLQSIAKENLYYNIVVVDYSEDSLNEAKKRWLIAGGNESLHKISWYQELPKEVKTYDLGIIATSSKNRASLISNITSITNINYWIIEKILAQSVEELEIIKDATSNAKKVYVNTPKRQMKWYKQIQSKLPNLKESKLQIIKSGGLWGLACNSIHYLDLVTHWTGETLVSINNSNLSKEWFKSKRKGYFEITGKLSAKFSKGTELILQSSKDIIENVLRIRLNQKSYCEIYEKKGISIFSDKSTLNGKQDLQSEIGGPIITGILTKGDCELPTLFESCKLHSIFLNSMLEHWNKSFKNKDEKVPIT